MSIGTHDPDISISVNLVANVAATDALLILLAVPQASNSLNGESVVEYSTTAEAQAAQTAGYISALTLSFVTAIFAQSPRPESVLVGRWDLVGVETAAAFLTKIRDIRDDFYYVLTSERGDTNLIAMATAVNNLGDTGMKLFIGQSDDTGLYTATFPVGLDDLQGMTRAALVYHGTDATPNDAAYVGRQGAYDLEVVAPPWVHTSVTGITPTTRTQTERDYLMTNKVNFFAPFGTAAVSSDPGLLTYSTSDITFEDRTSADWTAMRLRAVVTSTISIQHDLGRKIGVDASGQNIIAAVISTEMDVLTAAGHYVAGTVVVTPEAITDADETARRLRFTVEAQLKRSLRLVTITAYASV